MEHSVKTIPGTWYTITSTAPATVTELIQGETANHATLKKSGTASFRPSTTQITVNTEGKFTVLPSKAPGAPFLGTGGDVQFTDTEAEQLRSLAANSANLTAHPGDTSAHITEDERESWNEKQFTEKEEAILKRGVERDFLTRNNTYVFVVDENDPNNTLTNRPPLPDMEDEGMYALKAILNKEVVKEWLGIEASSSEPMSDKWLVVMTDKLGEHTTGMTASDGVTYTSLPAQLSNPPDPSLYTTVQVITCSTAVTANSVKAYINETFAMLEQAGVSAPEVEIYAYPLL